MPSRPGGSADAIPCLDIEPAHIVEQLEDHVDAHLLGR